MKFKKGDAVIITAGKDRGRTGKIQTVYPSKQTVLIPGLNLYKRHTKPRGERQKGGIIEISRPLSVANIQLICPKCSKPARIGYRTDKSGKKYRLCKKCQAIW